MILPGFPHVLSAQMMPPEFVGAIEARAASGSSLNVPAPAGIERGDTLVAFVVMNASSRAASTPSGWVSIDAEASSNPSFASFYRIAGASEPSSYTFSFDGGGATRIAIIAVRNVSGVGGFGALTRDSLIATITAPSVSLRSRSMLLCGYFSNQAPNTMLPIASAPSGMTPAIISSDSPNGGPTIAAYWQFPATNGAKTLTWAANGSLAASSVEVS